MQGDWYALGVLLYQMVAGDLKKPLARRLGAGRPRRVAAGRHRRLRGRGPVAAHEAGATGQKPEDAWSSAAASGTRPAQARRREAEKAESVKRKLATRKAMFRLAMAAGAAVTAVLLVVLFELLQERKLKERAVAARHQAQEAP